MPQTVLLVDDSNTVRTAAEMVSAKGDFHLVTAADEAEAVAHAHEQSPALLVVDCQMKDRSGYDVVRELRQGANVGHVPVLMLSGAQHPYDEALGRDVGAVGHLLKPFDTETFVTCITELLEQVPEDGQLDSIPPSTLPTPAQQAALNESQLPSSEANGQTREPSHFEINMDESMPPTPIRHAMASVIREVADDEILSKKIESVDEQEETLAAGEEDQAVETADADEALEAKEGSEDEPDSPPQEAIETSDAPSDVSEEASGAEAQAELAPETAVQAALGQILKMSCAPWCDRPLNRWCGKWCRTLPKPSSRRKSKEFYQ